MLIPKTNQEALGSITQRIRRNIEEYNSLNPQLPLSISIGFAVTMDKGTSVYELFRQADNIPLECRILAIVDAYDAMISDRPYRKAMSHEYALEELMRCKGTQFDPGLVDLFIRALSN